MLEAGELFRAQEAAQGLSGGGLVAGWPAARGAPVGLQHPAPVAGELRRQVVHRGLNLLHRIVHEGFAGLAHGDDANVEASPFVV